MRSKDFLGKGRTVLVERRERTKSFAVKKVKTMLLGKRSMTGEEDICEETHCETHGSFISCLVK